MNQEDLAARVFLIAHDEFSGKLRISAELLMCGLVAAQLADLVIAGRLAITDGRVAATGVGATAEDRVVAYVMEAVHRQKTAHPVSVWTRHLGEPLYELVGQGLVERGTVRRESGRGVLRQRPDRYPAADLLGAAAPRVHLEHMIRTPRELDLRGGFTVALVWALGIDRILDPALDRIAARGLVDEVAAHLPRDLAAVLDGARAAVAAVSLTVRR